MNYHNLYIYIIYTIVLHEIGRGNYRKYTNKVKRGIVQEKGNKMKEGNETNDKEKRERKII